MRGPWRTASPTLVVVGGDGMAHLGTNLVAGTPTRLLIVAGGTGNDVARNLGLPVGDPAAAVALLEHGTTRAIDAGRVSHAEHGERWFAGVLGAGFDAVVNARAQRMRWPRGQMRYNLAILRELPVFRPIPYAVELDGRRFETRAMLVTVANTSSFGGGMRVSPDADVADGLLDVMIVHELSIPAFLRVFPKVFSGTHVNHPAVETHRATRVRLEADGIRSQADGESFADLPIDAEVVPGALARRRARTRGRPDREGGGVVIASWPQLTEFAAQLDFPLDDFQVESCRAVEEGRGVLVAAPTGAGKTVVGEFAVHLALATGRKAFYTTPIKALSNQKYADLVRRHGADRVGLLTGDASINGEAPVVVMTTEVLRNMMYAGSTTLRGLGWVVMDEVHYLADRFRGAVWEEVIIHLPPDVSVVSLSATVSNAEEFGAWLGEVRGDTEVIVSEHRPVPLWQHMMVGQSMFDLFVEQVDGSDDAGDDDDGDVAAAGCLAGRARHGAGDRQPRPRARHPRHRGPRRVGLALGEQPRRPTQGPRQGRVARPRRLVGRRPPRRWPRRPRAAARGQGGAVAAEAIVRVDPAGETAVVPSCAAVDPAGERAASRSSSGSSARDCCRPSPSSSAAPAARPPSGSCWPAACASSARPRASATGGSSRSASRDSPTRTSRCSATGTSPTASPGASPRTTPACCPRSARSSRSSSPPAGSRPSSPPRRSPSASTCRRAPSCSRSS